MNQPARSQEPSMEEILASIRRIIADDDATKTVPPPESPHAESPPPRPAPPMQQVYAAPPPPPAPPPPAPRIEPEPPPVVEEEPASFEEQTVADQSADILDLTESMTATPEPAPPAAQFRTIDGNPDVGFDEAPEPPPAAAFAPAPPHSHDEQGRLISGATSAAVDFGLQCAGADGAVAKCPHA